MKGACIVEKKYIILNGQEYVSVHDMRDILEENDRLKDQCASIMDENEKLRLKSEIDPLTKTYRRTAAIEYIEKTLRDGIVSCGFIVFDLDNFKYINDTFGHAYGDAIIRTAAECILDIIGKDGIVGRFGGDEFFAFMPNSDKEKAVRAAEDIINKIIAFGSCSDDTNTLACSAGVSVGTGTITYSSLFSMADKALYSAKHNGKAHAELYNHNDMQEISEAYITYFDKTEVKSNPYSDMVSKAIEMASKAATTDDAVHSLCRHICRHFGTNNIKILGVDISQDMITVVYDFKEGETSQKHRKNNIGYYLHKDLTSLRDMLPDRQVVRVTNEEMSHLSRKLQNELKDVEGFHHLYYLNKTANGNYTICFFEVPGEPKFWGEDELQAIGEITGIVMVYADKVRHVSRREMVLQEMLDVDKVTQLNSLGHFFEVTGLIRKLAAENGEICCLIRYKLQNLREFNLKYSYAEGDALLKDFGSNMDNITEGKSCVSTHDNAAILSLVRSKKSREEVKAIAMRRVSDFINENKEKYPDFDLIVSVGVALVEQNESLFEKFDTAYYDATVV
jgi:diguanylate cyclase (GGDEF)-like protein